jgi:uncharacterized membrane protein
MPPERRSTTHRGRRRMTYGLAAALGLAAAAACEQSPTSEPPLEQIPIVVASVAPAEGDQGKRVEVRILGSGFAADDSVTWERGGAIYPGVLVDKVVFVSATELVATISIAPDADSVRYDVVVSPRKRGIGSERLKGTGSEIFKVNYYRPEALGWIGTGVWAGPFSVAWAVSDHGVIAGIGGTGNTATSTAVFWNGSGITPFGGSPGVATGINNRGWIVGTRGERNDLLFVDPFVYVDDVVTTLQPLQWPHASWAEAINDAGTVVGRGARDYWADPTWPLAWHRDAEGRYGAPVELPLPGGETWVIDQHQEGSSALDINERGDIVGVLRYGSMPSNSSLKAVLWTRNGDGSYREPVVLGGANATASGINENGWIAGSINAFFPGQPTTSVETAVVWMPGDYSKPILLSQAPMRSVAIAINDAGYVVGIAGDRAVLWQVDAQGSVQEVTTLLPSPGYTRAEPRSINANGWVVGYSERYSPTYLEATLWKP